jgi:hypothetical protein
MNSRMMVEERNEKNSEALNLSQLNLSQISDDEFL